jgi:hypothetical protein
MNPRLAFGFAIGAAVIALIVLHLQFRNRMGAANEAQTALAAQSVALAQRQAALQQEIDVARARLASLRTKNAAAPSPVAAGGARSENSTAGSEGSVTRIDSAVIADTPDLRQIRVRSYVGERRMIFAGLLHQLGLTPEQLQRFDAIHAEYLQATLDLDSSAKAQGLRGQELRPLRQQLIDARDAQLRELLGANYSAWDEANHTQGARSTVGLLLQQTFPAVGPIENAQTEKLITIFARHAQPAAPGGYDWSTVATEAASVLNGPQLEAFKTALVFRQRSEEAQALAAKRP